MRHRRCPLTPKSIWIGSCRRRTGERQKLEGEFSLIGKHLNSSQSASKTGDAACDLFESRLRRCDTTSIAPFLPGCRATVNARLLNPEKHRVDNRINRLPTTMNSCRTADQAQGVVPTQMTRSSTVDREGLAPVRSPSDHLHVRDVVNGTNSVRHGLAAC